jgi:hypothetical protein
MTINQSDNVGNSYKWTPDLLAYHFMVLREADKSFNDERDRRYSEVNIEREKALKIKEEADKTALGLAREIQVYKDEKANQLREQISNERGTYPTKQELQATIREVLVTIAPLTEFMQLQRGASASLTRMMMIIGSLASIATIVSLGVAIMVLIRMPSI